MCPRERSIQGTPLRRILSGKYELGFLNSLDPGVRGLAYIALSESPQPSNQTDLDQRLLFILKGDGGTIQELAPDWSPRWGGRPEGGGARPFLSDRWVPPSTGWVPMSSRLYFFGVWSFLSM
jgi:hypothetical protein